MGISQPGLPLLLIDIIFGYILVPFFYLNSVLLKLLKNLPQVVLLLAQVMTSIIDTPKIAVSNIYLSALIASNDYMMKKNSFHSTLRERRYVYHYNRYYQI